MYTVCIQGGEEMNKMIRITEVTKIGLDELRLELAEKMYPAEVVKKMSYSDLINFALVDALGQLKQISKL
jgi:hypothetical protein